MDENDKPREELIAELQECLRQLAHVEEAEAKLESSFHTLTGRESEVLGLITKGHSSKKIADLLYISVHTVNRHRQNIMEKLHTHKSTDLVKHAISHGPTVR